MGSINKVGIAFCFLLLLVGYFFFNGEMGLRSEEPRRALTGAEALLGDNYLVPTIHGEPYYNKPPLYNWILASSFALHGNFSPNAARLPGVISIWLSALLLFLMARHHIDSITAMASALIYLSFADLLLYGSVNSGEIDLFFSLVTFAQAACIFHFGIKKNFMALFIGSYLLAAIGFLTKGLPSIAFQGLTLIPFMIQSKEWRKLISWSHLVGISVFLILVGGYFALYSRHGDALGYLVNLWSESSSKSANEKGAGDIFKALLNFPLQLIKITLPWCLFVWAGWKNRNKKPRFVSYSILFIAANIWLYWISPDLRDRYLYPFLPFIALILAYTVSKLISDPKSDRLFSRISSSLAGILGIGFMVLPLFNVIPDSGSNHYLIPVMGAGFLLLSIYQWRRAQQSIVMIALVLGWLRLTYNVGILPIQAETGRSAHYVEQVSRIMEITQNQEIQWTGESYDIHPKLSLFGTTWYESVLTVPPLIAFQVPYEYTFRTSKIMIYAERPVPGKWYLGPEDYAINLGARVFHVFEDKAASRSLALYQIEKP